MIFGSEAMMLVAEPDSSAAVESPKRPRVSFSRKRLGSAKPTREIEITDQDLLRALISLVHPADHAELVASDLLQTFGDLSSVMHASEKRLRPYVRQSEGAIFAIRTVAQIAARVLPTSLANRPLIDCATSALTYLRYSAKSAGVESARVLYLDCQWRLLSDEAIASVDSDTMRRSIAEIARRAVLLQARGLVFVHIRPDLEITVTSQDRELFKSMREMCDIIAIAHGEHLLVSGAGVHSFLEEPAL